ncbi:hypothetical protein PtB15_10B509 [Puccinia triticina]|nr:hypothetical protein PtB15_10B509 [Puccinia triticina]
MCGSLAVLAPRFNPTGDDNVSMGRTFTANSSSGGPMSSRDRYPKPIPLDGDHQLVVYQTDTSR